MSLVLRTVMAMISIAIGFAGLVLPFLPGWAFFGVALMLLFPEAKFTRKTALWLEQRFPWTQRLLRSFVPVEPPSGGPPPPAS